MPLLHRPTFERALINGLHYSETGFASVVLLVCALGSRYSDDSRVCVTEDKRSAGWHYFDQVQNSLMFCKENKLVHKKIVSVFLNSLYHP